MRWPGRPVDRGWVAVAVLAGALVALLPLYWQLPLNVDRGAYATVAHLWLDGSVPYRDVVDFNTPGVSALFAVAFTAFGESLGAIALFELLWRLATLAAVFICGRSLFSSAAGAWAATVYAVLSFYPFADVNGFASKEGFAVLPVVLAIAAAWRYRITRELKYPLLAGLCLGLATTLKPTFAVAVAAFVFTAAAWRCADRSVRLWPALLAGAAGVGLPWLALLGYLVGHGAAGEMLAQVGLIGGGLYVGAPVSFDPFSSNLGLAFLAVVPWVVTFGSSAWAWAGAVTLWREPTRSRAWLLLPLALALCGAAIWQRKLFIYHWGATLGPLALLAGFGAAAGVGYLVRHFSAPRAVAALAVAVSLLMPLWYADLPTAWRAVYAYRHGQLSYQRYADGARSGYDGGSIEAIGARLRSSCQSGATLQVWGNASSFYWLSGCRPATRFIYDVPLTIPTDDPGLATYQQLLREEFVAKLRAAPASFIVVVKNDGHLWEGRSGEQKLLELPELASLMVTRYQLEESFSGYDLYRYVGDRFARAGVLE